MNSEIHINIPANHFFSSTPTSTENQAVLFVNGEMDYKNLQLDKIRSCFIIAVDGGLKHCNHLKITPNLIVGDFDSIEKGLLEKYASVEIHRLAIDKDVTDTEYAMSQVKENIKKVTLLGAMGGLTGHAIGNLYLLTRYPGKLFIESDQELNFAIDPRVKVTISPTYIGQKVSLYHVNTPAAEGINTEGLKWELKEGKLDKNFFGQSNECTKNEGFSVRVKKGELLVFLEKHPRTQ